MNTLPILAHLSGDVHVHPSVAVITVLAILKVGWFFYQRKTE